MASPTTKNDIILGAYSQLRISGITMIPSPSMLSLALGRLESSIAELHDIWNINLPYNFEDEPDLGSPHNLPKGLWNAVEVYLAFNLATDYGKQIPVTLAARLKGAVGALFKYSATAPKVDYPSRMPAGKLACISSMATIPAYEETPTKSSVVTMFIGERRSFTESFLTEMDGTEVIVSSVTDIDSELTLNSSSSTDYTVVYDITAAGSSDGSSSSPRLKITVTTDANKVITRITEFNLISSEI